MIVGIGTDITDIARIAQAITDSGERFLDRCFAAEERAYVDGKYKDEKARAGSYAKRWAAKEAGAKALGLGIREDIFLRDIVVMNDRSGRPALLFRGGAKARLTDITPNGKSPRIHLSLSDDGGAAVAFVIISAELGTGEWIRE